MYLCGEILGGVKGRAVIVVVGVLYCSVQNRVIVGARGLLVMM